MQLPSRNHITIRVAPQRCSYPHMVYNILMEDLNLRKSCQIFAILNWTLRFARVNWS